MKEGSLSGEEEEELMEIGEKEEKKKKKKKKFCLNEFHVSIDTDQVPEPDGPARVWDPSVYQLQEGEELDYDPSA